MIDKSIFLPLFDWMSTTSLGKAISESKYAFAIIEVFHLLGIILVLGSTTLVALRLVGLAMKEQKISEVARSVRWYTFFGLLAMLITGAMMVVSIPNKYYHSAPFWWKMGFFWTGMVFHLTLYRKVTRSDRTGLLLGGITALLAIVLWYGTGAFGRAIGFY
jgi:hypothetical protein